MFPGLDLHYAENAHLTTAGKELDYLYHELSDLSELDHDLSDLSDLSEVCKVVLACLACLPQCFGDSRQYE